MRGCVEGTTRPGEPFPWAPDLERCPRAVIPPVAFALLALEQRRRRLGVLPMGAERVGELPQWVVEALDAAAVGMEIADGVESIRARVTMEAALSRMSAGGDRGS